MTSKTAQMLPARAAEELRQAAKITDPLERRKAIDRITTRLRKSYPALFKGETDDEADRNQR